LAEHFTSTAIAPELRDPQQFLTLAQRHYENFPVGSWLLPKPARRHLHRIYAFARTADDLADELQDRAALRAFREEFLRHQDAGVQDVPLFTELFASIRELDLELPLFADLLDAFDQDCHQTRYTRPELLDYCKRSADPVGRLVLRVCGYRDPRMDQWSDHICTGLQLVNHLQDLREDLVERDRVYFPNEELEACGATVEDLRAPRANPAVRRFVLEQAERVGEGLAAGWPLIGAVRGRLRLELRAIVRGAAAVLARIRAVEGDVLGGAVHLSKLARARTVLAGLLLPFEPRWSGR
jgi:squalene synthase HpnC